MIGRAPGFATGGKPQRIVVNSRTPSRAVRTTGAIWSGKMPGRGGRLPVVSRMARAMSRMAAWPLVREYRLHIRRCCSFAPGADCGRAPPATDLQIGPHSRNTSTRPGERIGALHLGCECGEACELHPVS